MKHLTKKLFSFLLILSMCASMCVIAQADDEQSFTFEKPNIIDQIKLPLTEVYDYNADKITIKNQTTSDVTGDETYALINLEGKTLLKYGLFTDINISDNGCVLALSYEKIIYVYNNDMSLITKIPADGFELYHRNVFIVYKNDDAYLYRVSNKTCEKINKISEISERLVDKYNILATDGYLLDTGDGFTYLTNNPKQYYFISYEGNKQLLSSKIPIKAGFILNTETSNIEDNDGNTLIDTYDNIRLSGNYLISEYNKVYSLINKKGEKLFTTESLIFNTNNHIFLFNIADYTITAYTIGGDKIATSASGDINYIDNDLAVGFYTPWGDVTTYENDKTKHTFHVNPSKDNHLLFFVDYYKDINAYELQFTYSDSGIEEKELLQYRDYDGNDVFKNNFGITVNNYLGDGYLILTQNGKKYIGLLKGYPQKDVVKPVNKIIVPKDRITTPSPTKIIKIWKKKKKSKRLRLRLKKVKGVTGYQAKVFRSKNNAKKNKKALASKYSKKTTFTIKSKKIAKKKKLFVKARCYIKKSGKKKYSKWSAIKKVKVVKYNTY